MLVQHVVYNWFSGVHHACMHYKERMNTISSYRSLIIVFILQVHMIQMLH